MINEQKWILPIEMSLMFLDYLSVNLPLPVFPNIEHLLNVSRMHMQTMMSLFLIVYAISQLVWGALADTYGSRAMLLMSLSIASFGVFVTFCSSNFYIFSTGRLIEAVGIGSASVLSRTILGDWTSGKKLAIDFAYLISIISLVPGVSPFIGSSIFSLTGAWQSIFITLFVFSLLLILMIYVVYQNKPSTEFKPASIKGVLNRYWEVLSNRKFFHYFLIYGFSISLIINFYTIAPYIFLEDLHLTHSQYNNIVLLIGVSYLAGTLATRLMINYVSDRALLVMGLTLCLIACSLLTFLSLTQNFSLLSISVPVCIFTLGGGFISPGTNALALDDVKEKGSASALMASVIMVLAGIFSAIMIKLPLSHLSSYALTFGLVNVVCWVLFFSIQKSKH